MDNSDSNYAKTNPTKPLADYSRESQNETCFKSQNTPELKDFFRADFINRDESGELWQVVTVKVLQSTAAVQELAKAEIYVDYELCGTLPDDTSASMDWLEVQCNGGKGLKGHSIAIYSDAAQPMLLCGLEVYGYHETARLNWNHPGKLLAIDVNSFGSAWVVNAKGYIFEQVRETWLQINGLARDIGVRWAAEAWVTSASTVDAPESLVYYLNADKHTWTATSRVAQAVSIGPLYPYALDDVKIYQGDAEGTSWIEIASDAMQLEVSAAGGLVKLDANNDPYRRDPPISQGDWTMINGFQATKVSVDRLGNPWYVKVSPAGEMAEYGQQENQALQDQGKDISIGEDGSVWFVNNDDLAQRAIDCAAEEF